ncbi:MAG: hypothetical protein HYY78_15375 [Betaproteobacteria bacterium]|nr:hypothetical protein [Betaproteobacteria bacterium]
MKGTKTGGRTKGTPNKVSLSLKQAVLDTFQKLGGITHMVTWAQENPSEFYRIAARLVPPGVPVCIDGLEGALVNQGAAVVKAMAAGTITPEQASTVMQVLSAQAKVIEIDELDRRVKSLEDRQREGDRKEG